MFNKNLFILLFCILCSQQISFSINLKKNLLATLYAGGTTMLTMSALIMNISQVAATENDPAITSSKTTAVTSISAISNCVAFLLFVSYYNMSNLNNKKPDQDIEKKTFLPNK
jgi:hypothetical protein